MSTSYQSLPWSQFPTECLFYLVPMSVFHLVVFIVGCAGLVAFARKPTGTLMRRIRRFGLFMILLLFAGAFFNGLWSCLIYGRFYDSSDYVFGFIPFCPLYRQWVEIPNGQGHLMSVPLSLHIFWFLFTVGTWSVTVILYRLICRRQPPNTALEPTPTAP
jgi:hypothetical protein